VYTNTQETGCNTNTWQVSDSNSVLNKPASLNEYITVLGNKVITPSDNALHQAYTFYMKVTAHGGSTAFFGSYVVHVGCTAVSVTFTDNPSFITNVPLWVGDSVTNVYTFNQPSVDRAWCVILQNTIVDPNTSADWGVKINQCASHPCNVFSLVDTIHPEVVTFKIKTTLTNSVTHISPQATITITCNNNYGISEVVPPTNP
jgi:hypothetical protein